MTKTYRSQRLSSEVTSHRVVWTDEPYGARKDFRRAEFPRELADQDLLRCGPVAFDVLKQFDNGEAWVIVLEAEEATKEA